MVKALAISPHPDDVEFGCSGTLNRLISKGYEVDLVVFSTCEASLPSGFKKEDIMSEQMNSAGLLGIQPQNVTILDFPVRNFPNHRQEILDALISIRNKTAYERIFIPAQSDIHQDHRTIHDESVRAFKANKILGYELPWNDLSSHRRFFTSLSSEDVMRKTACIEQFKSQSFRAYGAAGMRALAELRGMQISQPFAESFELVRWIE